MMIPTMLTVLSVVREKELGSITGIPNPIGILPIHKLF